MDAGTFVISARAWISLNNAVAISALREIPITNSRVSRGAGYLGGPVLALANRTIINFIGRRGPANEKGRHSTPRAYNGHSLLIQRRIDERTITRDVRASCTLPCRG